MTVGLVSFKLLLWLSLWKCHIFGHKKPALFELSENDSSNIFENFTWYSYGVLFDFSLRISK